MGCSCSPCWKCNHPPILWIDILSNPKSDILSSLRQSTAASAPGGLWSGGEQDLTKRSNSPNSGPPRVLPLGAFGHFSCVCCCRFGTFSADLVLFLGPGRFWEHLWSTVEWPTRPLQWPKNRKISQNCGSHVGTVFAFFGVLF